MEENEEKIRIERVLGISVTSNAHFDCDSGLVAYPAGNTVVLLDTGSGTVVTHIVLETRKSISALQLKSNSLLFVASEESNFLRVVNWQSGLVKDIAPCQNVVCAAVSSVLGLLVTVGSDRVVSVWDFKNLTGAASRNGNTPVGTPTGQPNTNRGRKLASSSVACKVSCVSFSPDGAFFVTGGTRHLKFWYLQLGKNECVLTGRPAILGSEHSNADFKDVLTDGSTTYATANFDGTVSATLCQFDERRFLDKWVQLKTKQAFCMCMDEDLIFIGCAEGLIRCFRSGRLEFVATLPLPHHLGVDIGKVTDVTLLSSHPPASKFPNVVGIRAPGGKKIVAVYADHSLYTWDVQDVKRVGLSHSWLWHSGCIWDLALGPNPATINNNTPAGGLPLPATTPFQSWPVFITCSNDDTIRTWDIISQTKSNLYSNECVDIKYISTRHLDSPLFISHGNGVRCVGIGSSFVCCGDRQGNLRLWRSKSKNELIKIKAHKEEVLAMDVKASLIATASRDGSVNLYSIGQEIERLASLQEHKGSVTSVKFLISDRTIPPSLHVISCGADKNLVFRQLICKDDGGGGSNGEHLAILQPDWNGDVEVHVTSVVASKTPLFDLELDSGGKHVLVACQDACVRVYNVSTGKHSKTLRSNNPSVVLGTIIKVTVDPSGYYVAVASTDKSITVFDYYKGDIVATLVGHSELATALRFSPDFTSLLSVGGDSCVFVWNLPREMTVTMQARMGEKRSRQGSKKSITPAPMSDSPTNPPSPVRPDYRFSFGQLPDWAKKQMKGESASSSPATQKKPAVALPQGKWSERVEQSSNLTIKSFYNSDTVVPVPFAKPSGPTTTGSSMKDIPAAIVSVESPEPSSNSLATTTELFSKATSTSSDKEDIRSFEETTKNEGDDEESTDFYSDVGKSTDGETVEVPRIHLNKMRSGSDTDDSGSIRSSSRATSSYKDTSTSQPYEIVRSRNAELIMSVKLKNREISKSRLELEKRLEETRKKLQSIGYKSMSQSTQDLSRSYGKVLTLSALILMNHANSAFKWPIASTAQQQQPELQLPLRNKSNLIPIQQHQQQLSQFHSSHFIRPTPPSSVILQNGTTVGCSPSSSNSNSISNCSSLNSSSTAAASLSHHPAQQTPLLTSPVESYKKFPSGGGSIIINHRHSSSESALTTLASINQTNYSQHYQHQQIQSSVPSGLKSNPPLLHPSSAQFNKNSKVAQCVVPPSTRVTSVVPLEYLMDDSDDDDREDDESNAGGIRRTCSLSDLNALPNPNSSSSTTAPRRKRSFHRHRNEKSRNSGKGAFDPQQLLTRSVSVSALMNPAQSDSEPESMPATPSYMSKTISSQGKSRKKPPMVVSAYSQENLRDGGGGRLRVSASEQNLTKVGTSKAPTPMARSKVNAPMMKKPQQVHGVARSMAVAKVTGVRQGEADDGTMSLTAASSSVEQLKKSLDQVIHLRHRVSYENIPEDAPICRIIDDGLRAVQRALHETVVFQDTRPKIITEHEPTIL